jgi:hypothetical protein
VLSTHRMSQGWVRYRRCLCGSLSIEVVDQAYPRMSSINVRVAKPVAPAATSS